MKGGWWLVGREGWWVGWWVGTTCLERLKCLKSNNLSGLFTYCSFCPRTERTHCVNRVWTMCIVHHVQPNNRKNNISSNSRGKLRACVKIQQNSAQNTWQRPAAATRPSPSPLLTDSGGSKPMTMSLVSLPLTISAPGRRCRSSWTARRS